MLEYNYGENNFDAVEETNEELRETEGMEQEAVGYSSNYYKHEMEVALKNGNKIAYDNAKSNWANAKVRETVGSTTGEGEGESAEAGEEQEAVGYSSDYYKHQMEIALKNGNKIAYENAKANWAKAKVKETVDSTIA